ncbi:hypothetical protein GWI33_017993 [Rhynchophorus ferrugineus]|uniref:Uncharacterized protein n=1 Tax=Rhynchophorus ferrugineus TaxID=354439 RepID=A0A834M373_RHYFE|nr:hypothetical protein GWI33_017993 [Rhynchophorus ferrugineus]
MKIVEKLETQTNLTPARVVGRSDRLGEWSESRTSLQLQQRCNETGKKGIPSATTAYLRAGEPLRRWRICENNRRSSRLAFIIVREFDGTEIVATSPEKIKENAWVTSVRMQNEISHAHAGHPRGFDERILRVDIIDSCSLRSAFCT